MIRTLCIALLAICAGSVQANAAAVTFTGTLTAPYHVFSGPSDPLGLGLPETFVLSLNTTGAAINNGQIIFTGGSNLGFFTNGGTITIGGGNTQFNGINLVGPTGGSIDLTFNNQISSVSAFNELLNVGGGITLSGGFTAPAANGFYSGSVVGVPEPNTCAFLVSMVVGGGILRWRRKRAQA